jgi:hypothetical protein
MRFPRAWLGLHDNVQRSRSTGIVCVVTNSIPERYNLRSMLPIERSVIGQHGSASLNRARKINRFGPLRFYNFVADELPLSGISIADLEKELSRRCLRLGHSLELSARCSFGNNRLEPVSYSDAANSDALTNSAVAAPRIARRRPEGTGIETGYETCSLFVHNLATPSHRSYI